MCVCVCVCVLSYSVVSELLFVAPWTAAHQDSFFMRFSRQGYWSEFLFPTPGDLPDSRIELTSLASPALAGGFFTTEPLIKVKHLLNITHINPCV